MPSRSEATNTNEPLECAGGSCRMTKEMFSLLQGASLLASKRRRFINLSPFYGV